jgi:hypothetical protein
MERQKPILGKHLPTDRERVRDAYIALLAQFPDYLLTLATNQSGMSADEFRQKVRDFHRLLDRKLLGPRFYTKSVHERTDGVMCIEHVQSNIHGHAAIRFASKRSPAKLSALCKAIWRDVCPSGSADLQIRHGGSSGAGYATKEMLRRGFDDLSQTLILSTFVSR